MGSPVALPGVSQVEMGGNVSFFLLSPYLSSFYFRDACPLLFDWSKPGGNWQKVQRGRAKSGCVHNGNPKHAHAEVLAFKTLNQSRLAAASVCCNLKARQKLDHYNLKHPMPLPQDQPNGEI